ncbi:MAG: alpha/beta hydrolase, partial [Dehalococcoidia bacterium]|nr:alpha/beta hydrolase [Dehalococcoidia bacterium]
GDIPVRIYRPTEAGNHSLLVWYHGGGWVIGDLDGADVTCRELAAKSGSVVVSVDYRLAPEHRYPAAHEDCYAATVWAAENAAELGADASKLAVGGDSAGGNLAAVVSLRARDEDGPAIRFQLLVYPVTDHDYGTDSYRDNADGYLLTRDGMEWFWNHYLGPDGDGSHPHASPLRAEDLSGLPPAHVITAEYDPLRDEGEAYAKRLQEAGVDVTQTRYAGQIHAFYGMHGVLDDATNAADESAEKLKAALA